MAHRPALGLFTSLPILWNEAPDVAAMLAPASGPPHWARTALEQRYALVPLDTLTAPGKLRLLLMAQPRPLSPQENVALDGWVRGGGRLLLFADPMLTWESAFALGDRRRPQDVVLLSPILAHWGLELRFDEDQPPGLREIEGSTLPVNLAGHFALRAGGAEGSRCRIVEAGFVADCAIGNGRALVVADAALLEPGDSAGSRKAALDGLLDRAFGAPDR
ncbi:GldG family protein [Novosphingobium sp. KCTC 2891]|uniref:GldG family protein n=1 Tax=Novosphingobium sp. KCTC 2891 TaxID=2989730 RepID=UPI002223E393|nr:GldG family protein [Novosphingobium sp. KCTC 2891]MCW1381268.1 GldG family protein [Novosphingobium sp. KCTC 2891]